MASKKARLTNEISMKVSQPRSVWSRAFTFDSRAFFKSLGKAAIKGVAGQWADAISEIPEIAGSFGLETSPEDRAWILIRRALARATLALFHEYAEANIFDRPKHSDAERSSSSDTELQFTLTSDFFLHPASQVVPHLRADFVVWLVGLGIPEISARSVSQRLDSYFAIAIHNEWRSDPKSYEPIRGALESPFVAAAESEVAWSAYAAHIAQLVDGPVFGEAFSLRQIYIRPRGYYLSKPNDVQKPDLAKEFTLHGHASDSGAIVIDLMNELKRWIKLRDKDNAIRVISGGPGSGKSSCARMIAHSLLFDDHIRTILIPLHLLNVQVDFQSALSEYLATEGIFPRNPLTQNPTDPVVLILDGLDELEMQGRGAQEMAQQFVADVVRTLSILNNQECRLQAIISGRELAVQSIEGSFRLPRQVLHFLPYLVIQAARREYVDTDKLLEEDQRDTWWQRYGSLTGQDFPHTPKALEIGELGEVTAQPLLNYLVALAFKRGGLQLSSATSINAIYGDLVKAVYERGWSRHYHPAVRGISEESFVRFLEEVALSVWHGRGRTTTLREIEDHCKQGGLGAMIPNFEAGASSSISALLLAFYFRQKGRRQEGDKTFEFTHKSFGEYLTALRIVRAIGFFVRNAQQAERDFDHAWTDEEALARWLALCGPTTMDRYLLPFIRREYAVRGLDEAAKAQTVLTKLYQAFLGQGWPMERFPHLRFSVQVRWARNAEEALIACLNACARVTERQVKIDWPFSTSFGEALKRMQGQRHGPDNALVLDCLSYLDCSSCCLDMADLYAADLSHTDFSYAMLHFANLMQANLSHTSLRNARLLEANLVNAKLTGADVTDAYVVGVRIERRAPPGPAKRTGGNRVGLVEAIRQRGAVGEPATMTKPRTSPPEVETLQTVVPPQP
jgi:hypothetical protein